LFLNDEYHFKERKVPNHDYLVVPMSIEAWMVTAPMATNQIDPYHPEKGINRWQYNHNNVKDFLSPTDVTPQRLLSQKKDEGIYVQWVLPEGLRHGIRPASPLLRVNVPPSPNAVRPSIQYPPLPNRWLVARLTGTPDAPALMAWIVESDNIDEANADSPTFPSQNSVDAVVLGYKAIFDGATWQEPGTQGRPRLHAIANGDVAFSLYQPGHQNIFSLHDPLAGIDNASVSYSVMGWYADVTQDPLPQLWDGLKKQNPDKQPADLIKQWIDALQQQYSWPVQGVSQETLLQYAPTIQTVCHGSAHAINWVRSAEAPSSKQDSVYMDQMKIAIGSNGIEALNALLATQDQLAIPPALLQAFLHDGILEDFEELDVDERLLAKQHRAGFSKEPAGLLWELIDQRQSTAAPVKELPGELVGALNQLNQSQQDLEAAERLLHALQWQVYALWWKSGSAKSLMDNDEEVDMLNAVVETVQKELDDTVVNSFVQQVKQQAQTVTTRTAARDTVYQTLHQLVGDKNTKYPDYQVMYQSNAEFWQPSDPVILLTHVQSPGLNQTPANFTTRLSNQFATQATYRDSQNNSQTITWKSLEAKAPTLILNRLPVMLDSLWQELYLYDALIRQAIVIPQLSSDNANALLATVSGQQTVSPNDITAVAVPTYGLRLWSQPWYPLFLEWQVAWYPTEFSDWQFNEGQYHLNKIPDPVPEPQILRNRVVITPQATLAFKGRFKQFIERYAQTLAPKFPNWDTRVKALMQVIDNWDILCQRLSGFHTQLVGRDPRPQRVPTSFDETGKVLLPHVGKQAVAAPNPGALQDNSTLYQPLRQGQFWLQKLSVIDRFGQAINLNNLDPGKGAKSATTFQVIVSSELTPDPSMMIHGQSPGLTVQMIQLAPRIVQSARLHFEWIDTQPSATSPHWPRSTHIDINPVCGWVLPNYLDQTLEAYAPDGTSLGALHVVNGQTQWSWEPTPYSPCSDIPSVVNAYPHLGAFLQGLNQSPVSAYTTLLAVFDEAFFSTASLPSQYAQYVSSMLGRPLALARASWQLELNQPPYLDQGWWQTLQNSKIDSGTTYSTLANMKREAQGQMPLFDPSTFNFTTAQYLMTLGNPAFVQDGLVGYFVEGSDLSKIYQTFYSVYDYQPIMPLNPYASLAKDHPLSLGLQQGDHQITTLLIDPQAPIHSYLDILPVWETQIPSQYVEPALKKIQAHFKLGPLLTLRYDLALSKQDTMTSIRLHKPAMGTWVWKDRQPDGTWGAELSLQSPDTIARFEEDYEIIEGSLILKDTSMHQSVSPSVTRIKTSVKGENKSVPETLFTYTLTPDPNPLVISQSATLTIFITPRRRGETVYLQSLKINLPVGGDASALTNNYSNMKVSWGKDLPDGFVFSGGDPNDSGPISLGAKAKPVPINDTISLSIGISSVSSQIGNYKVSAEEEASNAKTPQQEATFNFEPLPKFPVRLSVTQLEVDKTLVYSGETVQLSWQAFGITERGANLRLIWEGHDYNSDRTYDKSVDVTKVSSYSPSLPIVKDRTIIHFMLSALVNDDFGNEVRYDQEFNAVNLLPATVDGFTPSAHKINVGSSIKLTWEANGVIDHYMLDIGEDNTISIHPHQEGTNSYSYSHSPQQTTVYQLHYFGEKDELGATSTQKVNVYELAVNSERWTSSDPNSSVLDIAIHPNGTQLYASMSYDEARGGRADGIIWEFSITNSSLEPVKSIQLEHAGVMAINPTGTQLYASERRKWGHQSGLSVFNITGTLLERVKFIEELPVIRMAVNHVDNRLCVVTKDKLAIITTDLKPVPFAQLESGEVYAGSYVAINNAGTQLYLTGVKGTVSVFNIKDTPPKKVADVKVTDVNMNLRPGYNAHSFVLAIHPNDAQLYVANTQDKSISVLDLTQTPPKVTSSVKLNGASALAIDPNGAQLYVTNTQDDVVYVLDLKQTPPVQVKELKVKNLSSVLAINSPSVDRSLQLFVGCHNDYNHAQISLIEYHLTQSERAESSRTLAAALSKKSALPLLASANLSAGKVKSEVLSLPAASYVDQLTANRSAYQQAMKRQQEARAKLPGSMLSDYHILTLYQTVNPRAPLAREKIALYQVTAELVRLHQAFLTIEALLLKESVDSAVNRELYCLVGDQKITGKEQPVPGDGWCTLYAIGVTNPIQAITELKQHLDHPAIRNYIREAIHGNYQAYKADIESFALTEGKDKEGLDIKSTIEALYQACQVEQAEQSHLAFDKLMRYLEKPEVQAAYLDSLIKTKYTDANIAAAYLVLSKKKLAVLADYGLADGRLVNLSADEVNLFDTNMICLLFNPQAKQALAHYNLFIINAPVPKAAQLISQQSSIFKPAKSSQALARENQEQRLKDCKHLLQRLQDNSVKTVLIDAFKTPPFYQKQPQAYQQRLRETLVSASKKVTDSDKETFNELLQALFIVPSSERLVLARFPDSFRNYTFALEDKALFSLGETSLQEQPALN
jgi:hypothetical protein